MPSSYRLHIKAGKDDRSGGDNPVVNSSGQPSRPPSLREENI